MGQSSQWLGTEQGGRAELWLIQQMTDDVWHARRKPRPVIPQLAAK
jgi:hypothetical protein